MSTRILMAAALIALTAPAAAVSGSVEEMGHVRVLNLWGTWSEMGYAHGYLMGPDIAELFEGYFMEMIGGASNYEYVRGWFSSYFLVPPELQQYGAGIISGAADTVSLYSPSLGRDLDVVDVYVVSSVPDLSALAVVQGPSCSSVSAWGEATEGDPELSGSPAVSRNLDYYVDNTGTVLDHCLLVTFDPDEGQDWVSIGFPGFMGSLSGISEGGVCATLNMGNHQGTTQYPGAFVPICMALAQGLYSPDFDGSGQHDVEDLKTALTTYHRSNSYDIHVVGRRDLAGEDSCATVVEVCNRYGHDFRYSSDEPDIAPFRMILTNHHRVLTSPVSCYRYAMLLDSLTAEPDVDLERLWGFMAAVGYPPVPGSGGTLHTMLFAPEQMEMAVAFAGPGQPSYERDPEVIAWDDLFPNHGPQGAGEGASPRPGPMVWPNPGSGVFSLQGAPGATYSVLDVSGRSTGITGTTAADGTAGLDLTGLPAGIYTVLLFSADGPVPVQLLHLE